MSRRSSYGGGGGYSQSTTFFPYYVGLGGGGGGGGGSASWQFMGNVLGCSYVVLSMSYAGFIAATEDTRAIATKAGTPTDLYELYHMNITKRLGSVFYDTWEYKPYPSYDFSSLYKEKYHTISEIATQSELDVFLRRHGIVPKTPNIAFPVTLLEYKFPNGVFEYSTYKWLHTDESVLKRVGFWRSAWRLLFPGTTFVFAATLASAIKQKII